MLQTSATVVCVQMASHPTPPSTLRPYPIIFARNTTPTARQAVGTTTPAQQHVFKITPAVLQTPQE